MAMVLNYLLSLLATALAKLFLGGHPDFAVGLILTGVLPCAGMIVAWTGLAGGDMSLALVTTENTVGSHGAVAADQAGAENEKAGHPKPAKGRM